jgi:hypothetical protein
MSFGVATGVHDHAIAHSLHVLAAEAERANNLAELRELEVRLESLRKRISWIKDSTPETAIAYKAEAEQVRGVIEALNVRRNALLDLLWPGAYPDPEPGA